MPHMKTMQPTMWPGTLVNIHFISLAYALEQYACHMAHVYPSALVLWSTYQPYSTTHTSPKMANWNFLINMLLPCMCQQQVCPSNTTCVPDMPVTSCAEIFLTHCTYMFHCTLHYYICKSTQQQIATFNYYPIIIYVPITDMPLKWHLYVTYVNYFI